MKQVFVLDVEDSYTSLVFACLLFNTIVIETKFKILFTCPKLSFYLLNVEIYELPTFSYFTQINDFLYE